MNIFFKLKGVIVMKTVSAVEARKHLGELINIVSLTDEEVTIERAGKKIAKLIHYRTDFGEARRSEGRLDFRSAAGLGATIWKNIDVEEYLGGERSQWS